MTTARTCCGNTTWPIPTRLERPHAKAALRLTLLFLRGDNFNFFRMVARWYRFDSGDSYRFSPQLINSDTHVRVSCQNAWCERRLDSLYRQAFKTRSDHNETSRSRSCITAAESPPISFDRRRHGGCRCDRTQRPADKQFASPQPYEKEGKMKGTKPSIVFCHGIWADGSCFSKVMPALQGEGHEMHCCPIRPQHNRRRHSHRQTHARTSQQPSHPRRPLLWRKRHHRRGNRRSRCRAGLHCRICTGRR